MTAHGRQSDLLLEAIGYPAPRRRAWGHGHPRADTIRETCRRRVCQRHSRVVLPKRFEDCVTSEIGDCAVVLQVTIAASSRIFLFVFLFFFSFGLDSGGVDSLAFPIMTRRKETPFLFSLLDDTPPSPWLARTEKED